MIPSVLYNPKAARRFPIVLVWAIVWLCMVGPDLRAEEGGTPGVFDVEEIYKDNTPSKRKLKGQHRKVREVVNKRLQQAQVLYKLGRYEQCVELCEEILLLDPSSDSARRLQHQANKAKSRNRRENLIEDERVKEDQMFLDTMKDATRTPERGPTKYRPKPVTDQDMPFARTPEDYQAAQQTLSAVIPELSLSDADLNFVLQLLFRTTGVNIVYKPEDVVGDTVTIHGRNMSLREILDFLSRSVGIKYSLEGKTVWVYKGGEEPDPEDSARAMFTSKIIPLYYCLTPSVDNIEDTEASGVSGAEETAVDEEGYGLGEVPSDLEAFMTWAEQNWPGWPPESRWYLDKKLNRLIIISTPSIIEEVEKVVKMLDVPPIQISITARFITITENALENLGIDWNLTPTDDHNVRKIDQKFTVQTSNQAVSLNPVDALGNALTPSFNLQGLAVLNTRQLNITLQALKSTTESKVLTAPQVMAYNHRLGIIRKTETFRYATDIETITDTTTTDTSSTSTTTLIPQFDGEEDIGIRLYVRPSVGADLKTVGLWVKPIITARTGWIDRDIIVTTSSDAAGSPSNSEIYNLPLPLFETQTIMANAAVNDGHTLVIGGLYEDAVSKNKRAVPGVSRIPVLGHLFKSKNDASARSYLLIFVTARIIRPDNGRYIDGPERHRRWDDEGLNSYLENTRLPPRP